MKTEELFKKMLTHNASASVVSAELMIARMDCSLAALGVKYNKTIANLAFEHSKVLSEFMSISISEIFEMINGLVVRYCSVRGVSEADLILMILSIRKLSDIDDLNRTLVRMHDINKLKIEISSSIEEFADR